MRLHYLMGILLIILWLCWGCKSRTYAPQTYPDQRIIFGSGGGFSGFVSTYVLLENGWIFDKPPTGEEFSYHKKIPRKKASALFQEADEISQSGVEMDVPGNIYYFLGFYSPDDSVRWTWGDQQKPPSESLEALYQTLVNLTRDSE